MANATKYAESRIDCISVSSCSIPTDFPESDGTLAWDKTIIVIVEIKSGSTSGIGYTYADLSTATLIVTLLRGVLEGRDAMDIPGCWVAMTRAIRNLGRPGIASMALSAIDIALWDLKAKLLQLPLSKLLGAVRLGIPIYGSGGFTSYSTDQLQHQLSGWVDSGIRMVKMKIGTYPERDIQRVRDAREAIGNETRLFVDANGAYTRKQALWFAHRFREFDVSWFEEPVSSEDLEGLHLIRDRVPEGMNIAAGEYGYCANYFRGMLDAEAVDILQADATRCGGISGFLQASALCEAQSVPLSAHTAPAVHMHICCAVPKAIHLEYFHDHARIENMLFDGVQQPKSGELIPDLTRYGLGLEVRHDVREKYAAR
jgi:L-alanine-DL-glutamate epimerase-like enolase superfamily enzyme